MTDFDPKKELAKIPHEPGVYLMSDAGGQIIYVGKARDLRQRLGSYRYIHGCRSRKTARLTARVAQIRWQVCDSEEAALLEENRLLRELRPRFNRVNTWPKAHCFIRVTTCEATIELSLSAGSGPECYGAFNGASRQNFGALLRLLWTAINQTAYGELPRALLLERTPAHYQLKAAHHEDWAASMHAFLLGESDDLLTQISAKAHVNDSVFHASFRQADAEAVQHFFRIGPQRNHLLRQQFGNGSSLISQNDLDDWMVRGRKLQRPEGKAKAT